MQLNIRQEFAAAPGARYRTESKHSGEEFRQDLLVKRIRDAISAREKLVIILDGTAGYGVGFLEESFGGLIREEGFTRADLEPVLEFVSEEEPQLIDEIKRYMFEAVSRISSQEAKPSAISAMDYIGKRVRIQGQEGDVVGVEPDGRLRVRLDDGTQSIRPAGEIDFLITLTLTANEADNVRECINFQLNHFDLALPGEDGWNKEDQKGLERIEEELMTLSNGLTTDNHSIGDDDDNS